MDENIQWLIKRAGFISASCLSDLMCKGRGKDWGDTAISYLRKVEYERMMGTPGINKDAPALRFGRENEPYAVEWIKSNFYADVRYYEEDFEDKPFITVPWAKFGATPDVDIADENGNPIEIIEIKCTFSETSTYFYFSPSAPESRKKAEALKEHRDQIAGQFLACPTVQKIHILKYNPQRDECDWDIMDPTDPRRGIMFTITREEMGDYLETVKDRIIKADTFLNTGLDLETINEYYKEP